MKRLLQSINKPTFWRFVAVGGASTAIDFVILFVLQHLGLPIIAANIISTSVAFCFSFYANKRFTFKTSGTNVKREMLLFVIVTLTGMWVLQNIVIALSMPLFLKFATHEAALLFAKLFATMFSMVWNYVLYRNIVFKHSPTVKKEEKEEL
ncbi:MAG: GtrA family protein [Candidatus Saccharimonas sp.]